MVILDLRFLDTQKQLLTNIRSLGTLKNEIGMTGTIFGTENIEQRTENYSLVSGDIVENVDVCVIGSGAAGAIIASKLSEAGKSVVLLEKGGYYDAEDMNQREADMIPLLWKNGGANFTDDLRIVIAQGQCLGGSTVINDAVCFKTPPIVREQWRNMGVDISEEKWDSAIDEVWDNINVSRVRPEELNKNAMMLKKACDIRHYKSSYNNRNCKDCMRCGFCHLGCHYETKQDMLVTYIRKAIQSSNLKVYCNCDVQKISYSEDMVDGVEGNFIDKSGKTVFAIRINARVVVLSAGSIASSQLLLKNSIAPGKAGKGLSLHPAPALLGKFAEEINAYNGIPMAYTCEEFGVPNGVDTRGFLIESIFLPIFSFAVGLPSFLVEHAQLMKDFTHYAMAGIMIRDESNGTITLSEKGNPKVHYELSRGDIANLTKGVETLAGMWFDAGAERVISGHEECITLNSKDDIPKLVNAIRTNPNGLALASAHPQGGNKMGQDKDTCVVDSNCRVHSFENLYVSDASVFPTSVGVNPQITVMAIATMTADHINSIWDEKYAILPLKPKFGKTCSITQPMYCSSERLETMFNQSSNSYPMETLINAKPDEQGPDNIWSFDKKTMTIHNNKFWRGFFPTDQNLAMFRYFGGFWKKFYMDGVQLKGLTHAYEMPVDADNIPELKDLPGFGKVIHLKYTGIQYKLIYDLLKIVDKDTVIGRAFFGIPPDGIPLFSFSMSRKYNVDFMSEDDHETIFTHYGNTPDENDMSGTWHARLVSDSVITPTIKTFTYATKDERSQLDYLFRRFLEETSNATPTQNQISTYNLASWHSELKIVSEDDFAVGKWCSPWTKIPLALDFSFVNIEKRDQYSRLCIRFILKRND